MFIILFCQKIQRNSEKTCFVGRKIMTDKIVVLSTCASAEEAQRVARALVEKRLAACVNVMPGIRSVYRWRDAAGKDAIQDDEEVLLCIKTSRALMEELKERDRAAALLRSARGHRTSGGGWLGTLSRLDESGAGA